MAVEVYYWNGKPGHVAIRVDGGSPPGTMYLSRWPATLSTALLVSLEAQGNQYGEDVAAEGNRTPLAVRLTKLDETAVKNAIVRANRLMIYNDFAANCASHVKFCLDAGLPGVAKALGAVTSRGLLGFIAGDTPFGVYHYACGLRTLYG